MPMIKMGEKRKILSEPMLAEKEKSKIRFPDVSLPLKIMGSKQPKKGMEVVVVLKGKVIGFSDNDFSSRVEVEIQEGGVYSKMSEIPKA